MQIRRSKTSTRSICYDWAPISQEFQVDGAARRIIKLSYNPQAYKCCREGLWARHSRVERQNGSNETATSENEYNRHPQEYNEIAQGCYH